MGKWSFNGVDEISDSFEEIANLSDDEKWTIISAGAEVLLRFQQSKINQVFKQRTGQLFSSLKISRKTSGGEIVARIAPSGKRTGNKSGKRKYKGHSHGSYEGTNAEVAYILEYGSPRIKATHWMETANNDAESDFIQAEENAWDEYLKTKNL